ncbi:RDD family protein [Campylobacter corcagiensis]|uniref:RDD family protein n=1 Tax=Campylobacter corcagiensis TaxID=1448857 RepID=A0A7M1LGI3_9BACT|nr:RDD family protein [Campylobacter corcagiensis]QKF64369.1 RDD family protein [Campylobacter corcagiensis]QOQ87443.1 RDD family protein [Campylobacter corcagiensis]
MNFDDIKLASIQKRSFAFLIDEILLSFLLVLAYSAQITQVAGDKEALVLVMASMSLPYMILKFLYHTLFIYTYGATLGKLAVKIRCVNYQNQRPNFNSSLLRSVVRILSEAVFYIGFLWALFNPALQTWHDKLAKTLVVDVA